MDKAGEAKARADGFLDATDYVRALEAYQDAIGLARADYPDLFKLHVNRGVCLEVLGREDEARAAYQRALELNPACEQAHANLQQIYLRSGKAGAAAPHAAFLARFGRDAALRLREALNIPPIQAGVQEIELTRRGLAAKLSEIEATCSGRIERPEVEINATGLYLSYHGRHNAPLLERVSEVVRKFYPAETGLSQDALRRGARGRPRIGFVSPFFYNHSIGRLYGSVLKEFSRKRFETFAFSINAPADETHAKIQRLVEHHADLPNHLPTVIKAIREAELDILYFPDIGLHPSTSYLAYWRLAPIQCATWGHPDTTGLDTIDHFISSKGCEVPGSEKDYTEPLVKLDGFFMPAYARTGYTPAPKSKADFGVGPQARVYLCGQTLFKVHPHFDEAVGRILRADPEGHMRFMVGPVPAWVELLKERFRASLPDVHERIGFVSAPSTVEFLGWHRAADAVLDTFHFGGGISALDTFEAGVPMVTLPGPYFRGRQAAACYAEMEIDDCVASTSDEFVSMSLLLARDSEFRREVSIKIAARNKRLFGRTEAVRALEDFLLQAVERHRDSR